MSINNKNYDLLCSSCKEKIKLRKNSKIKCKNNIIIYNCRSTLSTYDKMMKDVNELTMKEWLDNWWTCIH